MVRHVRQLLSQVFLEFKRRQRLLLLLPLCGIGHAIFDASSMYCNVACKRLFMFNRIVLILCSIVGFFSLHFRPLLSVSVFIRFCFSSLFWVQRRLFVDIFFFLLFVPFWISLMIVGLFWQHSTTGCYYLSPIFDWELTDDFVTDPPMIYQELIRKQTVSVYISCARSELKCIWCDHVHQFV